MKKFIYTLFVFVFLLGLVSCGVNKKSSAKQPNCEDIEGLEECDIVNLVPKNYIGIVKCCKNGKVEMFVTIKDGKPDGLLRGWHENGQLQLEMNMKDGKPDGLVRGWHENGQLDSEGNMKNGKPDDLIRRWWSNGQLKAKRNYKDGVLLRVKCWDKHGNKKKCKCYDENGINLIKCPD